jgi:hypothetical protein
LIFSALIDFAMNGFAIAFSEAYVEGSLLWHICICSILNIFEDVGRPVSSNTTSRTSKKIAP